MPLGTYGRCHFLRRFKLGHCFCGLALLKFWSIPLEKGRITLLGPELGRQLVIEGAIIPDLLWERMYEDMFET